MAKTFLSTDGDLLAHARRVLTTTFHPVGTCMMGQGPMAVVEPRLRLHGIAGILNGTCNYILSRIESARIPFSEALEEAQARGYAEADASEDLDGGDARAKGEPEAQGDADGGFFAAGFDAQRDADEREGDAGNRGGESLMHFHQSRRRVNADRA